MNTKATIRQLLNDARLDEAIDEFNRRYLPSTRLISHRQREEAKKCLLDLFLTEEQQPVAIQSPNPPASQSSATEPQQNDVCDNSSRVKKLQDKIKKLEARKEEMRAFGMKCFNEAEELRQRLALVQEERDKLIHDNKILETNCDKLSQQSRYHQSNSQILEDKCKMLQREFEQVKSKIQAHSYSYSSQGSSYSEHHEDFNEPHMSPDIIADSMDSESVDNYCDLDNSGSSSQVATSRYPNIEPDLVPPTYIRPRSSGPHRAQTRFPEQRTAQTKPNKQPKATKNGTTDVTRERSPTTINDLVLAKYLVANERVKAFAGKNGQQFFGIITMSEKQQYGIMDMDEYSNDDTVYINPSSWIKRDVVLQQLQKNTSIARGSQYSGWECAKVLRNCPKTKNQKWMKLSVIRKMYDSAVRESSQQPSQNYTFTQVGGSIYTNCY